MSEHHTHDPISWRRSLALLVAATTWASASFAQPTDSPTVAAGSTWTHELVRRSPDASVRFGQLPNGLRYALKFNGIEANGIAFRLRIGTGALKERDGEQGFAHFLEHMAFRGSVNVPDGEVTRTLQRQGLAFGADTNAITTLEHTVYRFDFPKGDRAAVQTGLTLFREIADRLTLTPELIEQEKGVVLSEARASDQPILRMQWAEMAQSLPGMPAAGRPPVGNAKSVQAITAERLRSFYEEHYRPDNATLVIVGYFDVDAVERKIHEQFGDWKVAAVFAPVAPTAVTPAPLAVEFVAEGAPEFVSLTWRAPPEVRLPTLDVEREQMTDQIGIGIINSRLNSEILKAGSTTMWAMASWQPSVLKLAGLAKIAAVPTGGRWKEALDQVAAVLRRVLADGVTDADLKQVIPAIHTEFRRRVSVANTQPSAPIADAIVQADLIGDVYQSAWQALQAVEPLLTGIKPEEVTASLRRLFGAQGPFVFRSAPSGAGGTLALAAQVDRSMHAELLPPSQPISVADWPYTNFGEPSEITGTISDAQLGTTTVRFANDTRLIVKTTSFDRDQVLVHVAFGQGRSGIQPQYLHAIWALDALALGGTTQRSLAEFVAWNQASGKQLSLQVGVEPRAFVLQGATRRADLLAQLQVLTAFSRDPGFRPELDEKLSAAGPMVLQQRGGQAGFVFAREFTRLMTGGERRLAYADLPDPADVALTKPGDLSAVLREALAGAADVVIVGDVSAADAIAAVRATLGSGPGRPRAPKIEFGVKAGPEPGRSYSFTHTGRRDQGILSWAWITPDYWAEHGVAAYTGAVAAALLRARLEETVRAQLGITYIPNVTNYASVEVSGRGTFNAVIETPPDKFDAFRELLRAQLKELAVKPVSDDELLRARGPLVEASRKSLNSNAHWLFWLPILFANPKVKVAALNEVDGLQSVTAAQVHAFFKDRIANRLPVEVAVEAK